jgi:hypothetical protein
MADDQLVGGGILPQEIDQFELVIGASPDQPADVAVGDLLGQGAVHKVTKYGHQWGPRRVGLHKCVAVDAEGDEANA